MSGGPRPAFLQKSVAYYVMGADVWKYAESLEAITARSVPYCLQSDEPALSLARPGQLSRSAPKRAGFAQYIYDPRDTSRADLEAGIDVSDPAETRMVVANDGHQLVYETEPFTQATEISGMFNLDAWIAIDQPDTDFQATVYEVTADGNRILLTSDIQRARYRTSLRSAALITSRKPLRYVFDSFTFTSRLIAPGSRLSLIVGPINSIYTQKNYNSGWPVSQETMADARTVTVQVHGGGKRNSLLYVPFAEPGPERTDATCHSSAAR